jgi:hypothetical protein
MDDDDIKLDLHNRAELDQWAAEQAGPRLGDIRQHLINGFSPP